MRRSESVVVFDGDDTLWGVEHLYDRARKRAGHIVAKSGLDPIEWSILQQSIDEDNVQQLGLSAERFPLSCVQAYQHLCRVKGTRPRRWTARRIRATARAVFDAKAPVVDGAHCALQILRSEGHALVLLTKGEEWVQKNRIVDSGLSDLFDATRIVDAKDPLVFVDAVRDQGGFVRSSWSVGNSIGSDINLALDAGLSAIWIDSHVWSHERREVTPRRWDRFYTASDILQVPDIVASRNVAHA